MLKYAKYAVPYLIKSPRRIPVRQLAGLLLTYITIVLAGFFLLMGALIWLSKNYGSDIAFAVLGTFLLCVGLTALYFQNRKRRALLALTPQVNTDPLAQYVPASIRDNPAIQKLMLQIEQNPLTAAATAVTVGVLLSNELFEDSTS